MMRSAAQVCVVGAGLAGLSCALAAASRGLSVQVFEDAAQTRVLPAYVEVVPSMLRDLAALGVADECIRAGFVYRGIEVIDSRGQMLLELPTQRLAGARFPAALGIQYGELLQVLERAGQRHGVSLERGARVVAVTEEGEQARLELANGEFLDADMVLMASGAGCHLRTALFPHVMPAATMGQAWWYFLLRRPVDLDRPVIALGTTTRRAVLVPVRGDLAGIALTEAMPPETQSLSIEHLRLIMMSLAPRVRDLATQLEAGTPFVLRQASCGLLDQPWHRGSVLAVGDCAHKFSPHFGQAAAQAIEDASVLGDLLESTTRRSELFQQFQLRREERVRQVFDITCTAARWDLQPHGDGDLSQLLDRLAHTVAPPALKPDQQETEETSDAKNQNPTIDTVGCNGDVSQWGERG